MKAVRFGDLVRAAGRPHTLTLWMAPNKNPELQAAIRTNRVLTVERPNVGTKRDVGYVGFQPTHEASYLIFPRPLEADARQRVIGINYALIDEPTPKDPIAAKRADADPVRKPLRTKTSKTSNDPLRPSRKKNRLSENRS